MWFIFLLLAPALALRTHEPPPPEPMSRSSSNIIEDWLTVRLNHFDASNTDTFRMRYYYNPQFASNEHIVIYVGGEWEISPGWLRSGLAYELAERIGAALFYTEHRYYGKTRPTTRTTVPELRFLNVDQALGDLAQFIEHVRSDDFEHGRYRNANVALFGCSYAGSMATWMRLAYPHLITTAMSDSGPLHAQEDFPEYLEVITTALREQGSEQCVTDISTAMTAATALLETDEGLDTLSTLFKTCSRLQRSPLDFATLFWFGVTETFAYLVQYATPGDIPRACGHITNSTLGEPLTRLASWVTAQSNTQPCIEARYSEQVAVHTDTSYDAPSATIPELRFLNVDQALGDLAQFIEHVRSDDFEHGRYRNANVALFGCSYAGSMATWMRLAYPHLITTAMSDSGPLHAQEDFPEYLEVITTALREQGSEQCVTDISTAMTAATALLETDEGLDTLSTLFKTCSRLQRSPLDFATLFWFGVTETFAYLVQYATPGDIPRACGHITNSTLGEPLTRLASWVTAQSNTQPCIEARYSEQVAVHTDTSYDAPSATMRLWTYQTCTEYGWYQTTSSSRQPFLSVVPLEYFHQMCQDFFNADINLSFLRSAITRTNRLFAGLEHLPDHVVSVAGGHDPWSPMGPNRTHGTHLAPVYVVDGVSHCRAIRPRGDSETLQLEETKLEALLFMDHLMTGLRASAITAALSRALAITVIVFYAAF